ncbi:MAG: hypothetical protein H6Q36_1432, partial [Chloroflexi bacterium]|nr:hypothetical protein [Chloroflexota bacterium]
MAGTPARMPAAVVPDPPWWATAATRGNSPYREVALNRTGTRERRATGATLQWLGAERAMVTEGDLAALIDI